MTLPWEGSGHHAQIHCTSHQSDISIISSPPGKATGLCVPLLLPQPSTGTLQRLARPLSLTFSTALPTGAGPPLLTVMLQWVRSSVCTTWECTFKCNSPNYLLFCTSKCFWDIFLEFLHFGFFSAPLILKINAKSSNLLLLKQSHLHIYFHSLPLGELMFICWILQ